ncbi:Ig-like domain-containing protein [Paenibacillus sp. alder61]|uniref:BIG2 domain-containing protein n=1 Tax=Paenibacillus faecis TaxID=862114 RepID=A0A5D0CZ85_9BACL|nr:MULTISPECIES: Ig-like domain-containing protein [Paenibacillus]MCA1293782.1 Ig-like domain-containing protein [Paenibacillus sp. alder61]TYA15369.1 hypothetical protein FRY98_07010 [Paenibacillus faecis]
MSQLLKRLTAISLSCLLAWTVWPGTGKAAASPEKPGTPKIEWSFEFGQAFRSSKGNSVISATDGGYLAVGDVSNSSTSFGYVVKTDESGRTLWEQTLNVTGDPYTDGVTAQGIIPVREGGYLVSGAATDRTARPLNIPYLAKLDNQGSVEWSRYYHLSDYTHFYAESATETVDGGFVFTGYGANSWGEAPAYLMKVDREGNELWHKTFSLGDNQTFNDVRATPDGGVLAVGKIDSVMHSDSDASLVVKVDANGKVQWEKQQVFPGSGRSAWSIQMTSDGSYMVSGMTRQDGKQVPFVFKMDENGEILWEKTYPLDEGEHFFQQLVSTPDGYALLGRHTIREDVYTSSSQYQILRIDHDGNVTGHLRFGGPGLGYIEKGTYSPDGAFLMTSQVKLNERYLMQLIKVSGESGQPSANLKELRFTDPALELGVGERKPSVVEAVYADGTASIITNQTVFTSRNPEIAAVDRDGFVTGVSLGTTEIVAEYAGFSARLPVTVTDIPGETPGRFSLDSEDYSLMIGGELDTQALFTDESGHTSIVNGETRFTVADPEIARVDERGFLYGLKPGLTSLTAVYRGHTFTASVLVVKPYVPVTAPPAPEAPEVNEGPEGPQVPAAEAPAGPTAPEPGAGAEEPLSSESPAPAPSGGERQPDTPAAPAAEGAPAVPAAPETQGGLS